MAILIAATILIFVQAPVALARTAIFRLKDAQPAFRLTAKIGHKKSGHKAVVTDLMATAARSQAGFLSELRLLQMQGKVESFKPFWIVNAVSVTAPDTVIQRLSSREEVAAVLDDLPVVLVEPVATGQAVASTTGHQAGLGAVNAPEVWRLGLDGSGRLVCNFDTGVSGNHPALMSKYRGNNGGTASESWFDPYTNTDYPVDSHGHGTHTMGIMVGSANGDTVGVAPGAQWIAAAVVDRGGGIQRSITDLLAAFQWAADPDGNPATSDDVPDVVNNSWGIPLGYYPPCDQTFWEAVDNLEAAGVVCIFAAGNEGPYPSTIRTPADRIASAVNSFAVGAVDGNDPSLPIAGFSSRGPSGCDSTTIKPEVSAPGVWVRSASRNGGYIYMSGTSMAAPHVAGAVAILRQFNSEATPAEIKMALILSATDLGSPGEDNSYGHGVIDIRRALYFMPAPANPFPALISTRISGDGVAGPGEAVAITVEMENLGSPAQSISGFLQCPDPRVTIPSGQITFGPVGHIDTVTAGPWNVILGSEINAGEVLTFELQLTAGSWSDSLTFRVIVGGEAEPGVATHDNGLVRFSFSNFGQFGLGPGSLNPQNGEGFRFPPEGFDLLNNASLLLATETGHVSDGAISVDPSSTDDDFRPIAGGYPRIIEPGLYSDQDGFSMYDDSTAEHPLGLTVSQRSFCWIADQAAPFVTVEFTIQNNSTSPIDSLYAGIFCDWDLPLTHGDDDVAGYIDYESLGYVADNADSLFVGVKTITSQASSYAAIDNLAVFGDGFSDSEKFDMMTAGFQNISYDMPGNYSNLISVGPYRLPPGDSEVVAFSFVAGNSIESLIAAAHLSFVMYPGLTSVDDSPPLPARASIISSYPNPFNSVAIIRVSGSVGASNAIAIYDIAGRLVRTLPLRDGGQVSWDGTDDDGRHLASGLYFAKLEHGQSSVRKMILLK